MFRCGQQKGSTIGRVLDERGSGPEKTVGTVEATSGAQGIGFAPLPRKSLRRTSAEPDGPDASAAMDRGGMRPSAEAFP